MNKIDVVAGMAAKEEGIERAAAGSGRAWQDEALELIRGLAQQHPFLCSDDLWASGLSEPPESRALGSVMRNAKTAGYIEATSQFVNTHQASRHHAPVRVWQSKLRGPQSGEYVFKESLLMSRQKKAT